MREPGWLCVRTGLLAIAVALTLAPLASAEPVNGTLLVKGTVTLPSASDLDLSARAVFIESTASVSSVQATLRNVTVHVYREEYPDTHALGHSVGVLLHADDPVWTESRLTLALVDGPTEGWLGVHPGSGSILHARVPDATTLHAEAGSDVGNSPDLPDEGHPSLEYYHAVFDKPIVATELVSWTHHGAGTLKLSGLTLRLETDHNSTVVETRGSYEEGPPAKRIERWLTIDFESGDLTVAGAPTQVVADHATASWKGPAQLSSAVGIVHGAGRAYDGKGATATLDGDLRAALAPVLSSGETALSLDLSGDLADSTLASRASAPIAAGAGWLVWIPIVVIGAAVTAGATVYVQRRRRQAPPDLSAEEYAKLGEAAADAERYDEAAAWLERARRASPTSRRLVVEHAYVLAKSGKRDAALVALASASGDDPDAALLEARLLAEAGRDPEAAARLVRALDASPSLLLDVENDPALASVRGRDDVRDAVRRARRALR